MTDEQLNKLFTQAARKALIGWDTDLPAEEIVNELWVWYLESPYVRGVIEKRSPGKRVMFVRMQVFNILTGEAKARDLFEARSPYSSDNVKDALKGESTNHYLVDILPMAIEALRNDNYAEALRSRYTDGIVPKENAPKQTLKWAVKSLTETVNYIAITAGIRKDENGKVIVKDGPGSKNAVFPDIRKAQGDGHSDPTANIAILLIEHPELRDEYLHETPLPEFLGGRC
ncbi:hypothetical protein SEA_DIGNITY_56 [Mycobacterium phage Dignity]|uniref:Helix-turn-helix DNA-binding protein n=4 Tax=Turbidovirus TaxID=2948936 RepID=A0A649VE18_9CAUD|nr:sigma-K factor [Mycobacterium phage Bugsy]AWH13573.1 hypothetical protein SEA_ABBYPAIGE_56 [Mycobacterium phage AbbyPaige]QBI96558.1 RNA polymerase sigma factor [Mycobacterium phage Whabigail7]QUE25731.1 DNA binding protein [Mycobacterium phage Smeagan]QZD98235.1 hypothetical protein SEA_DIGNITY_56 [Mycobacterium phage Dignity]QGJ90578.1 helix-turn-helix DNA-binding protein [Mycobacterium phage Bugsy]